MIDYSKSKENVSYYDCIKCIHRFGKNVECFNCNYYTDCMINKEIDDYERMQDKALENFYRKLENEEYPL